MTSSLFSAFLVQLKAISLDRSQLMLFVIAIGAFILWMCLATLSRLINAVRTGQPILGLVRRYRIPSSSGRTSVGAADDRRNRLQTFLAEFADTPGVPIEFIEVPPGLEIRRREFARDEGSPFWRAARLHLQPENNESLLLERVTDVLVYLERIGDITPEDFPISIRLERRGNARAPRHFQRRVIAETTKPRRLRSLFKQPSIREWLGIGVEFVRPIGLRTTKQRSDSDVAPPEEAVSPQGRCTIGSDGLEGTVGGLIRDNMNGVFGVTCRHVLSSNCGSLYWRGDNIKPRKNEFTQESPDAAFINLGSPCFAGPGVPTLRVLAATQSDIELSMAREIEVRKTPNPDQAAGIVVCAQASGFKLGHHFYRGPHFQITPAFRRKFWLTLPLSRRFSRPGDSGAWVVDPESRRWLGMIVGGLLWPNALSIALCSQYVCEAFRRRHTATTGAVGSLSFEAHE